MHAHRRLRGQPGLVFVIGTADVDHLSTPGSWGFSCATAPANSGPAKSSRPGVVDDVDDLGRRQAEVDHRVGGADLRAGQRQSGTRVVQVEHGDAVGAAGPARRPAATLHALGQLRPAAARVAEGDGGGVGSLAGQWASMPLKSAWFGIMRLRVDLRAPSGRSGRIVARGRGIATTASGRSVIRRNPARSRYQSQPRPGGGCPDRAAPGSARSQWLILCADGCRSSRAVPCAT